MTGSGASLREVLETLGTSPLAVWSAPADLEVGLRDVVVHDVAEGLTAGAGDLLLAAGVDPQGPAAAALVEQAAAQGVAAVVVRGRGQPPTPLAAVARRCGIALLAAAPAVGWARVTSLLRGVLSTSGVALDAGAMDLPRHDLVTFANALSEALGGSVLIFSPQQEVLAASRLGPDDDPVRRQAIFDQHGPRWYRHRLRERGVYRRLWEGEDVVDVEGLPELQARRRLAVAIRAGEEILGSIWVAEGQRPLPSDAHRTLRQATKLAGLHLLRLRTQARAQERFVEGLARQLLAGEADVEFAAGGLGIDPRQPCAVVACQFVGDPDGAEQRLAELVAMHLAAYRCTAVPVVARGRVDVLLGDLAGTAGGGVVRAARAMVAQAAETIGQPLLGAVSRTAPGLAELHRCRAETELILQALRRRPDLPARVATLDDVWAAAALAVLGDLVAARPDLRGGRVRRLLDHDRQHRTAYTESLAAYLETFGEVRAAARRLRVHPNTLRHRLRRLREISGLALDDPDERLMAALLLRVERDRGAPPPAVGTLDPDGLDQDSLHPHPRSPVARD